jgi:hypothetical protein
MLQNDHGQASYGPHAAHDDLQCGSFKSSEYRKIEVFFIISCNFVKLLWFCITQDSNPVLKS